jgi:sorting nexin-29
MYSKVKNCKYISSEFKINKGLKQGDAALLFNAVLEIAITRSKVETRGFVAAKLSQIMAYADDVVIMGRRLQDAH